MFELVITRLQALADLNWNLKLMQTFLTRRIKVKLAVTERKNEIDMVI